MIAFNCLSVNAIAITYWAHPLLDLDTPNSRFGHTIGHKCHSQREIIRKTVEPMRTIKFIKTIEKMAQKTQISSTGLAYAL
jgi:hypothetical protein